MKLSLFCVVLLVCSVWINYQQRQKMQELRGSLAMASAKAENLQNEIAAMRKQAPGLTVPTAGGAWMYDKRRPDPLSTPTPGTTAER